MNDWQFFMCSQHKWDLSAYQWDSVCCVLEELQKLIIVYIVHALSEMLMSRETYFWVLLDSRKSCNYFVPVS